MSTENNTTAQVQPTGAETPAQPQTVPQQGATQEQFAGIQKRIDELTAEKHAARDQVAQLQVQLAQQAQLIAERAYTQAPQQTQQQALPEDLDPNVRKALDIYTQQMTQRHNAEMGRTVAQLGGGQLEALLAKEHPMVAQQARFIWNDMVRKGLHTQGQDPQSAITWARGQLMPQLLEESKKGQVAGATQQFNQQAGPIATQSSPPNPGSQQTAPVPDLDDDPEAASAALLKRLGDKAF